ncbi:MAG: hypothetical protein Q4B43_11235 [Bacteroidota bacterium]|nr:hypothetical protein [Bacteroidota bacterium]
MNIEKILAQKRLRILLNLKEDLIYELKDLLIDAGRYPYNKLEEALDFAIKMEAINVSKEEDLR